MSEFAPFQYPLANMGFVREHTVAPMPVAHVIGPWAGTPEADALLRRHRDAIVHEVRRFRQHYLTGILPTVRRRVDTPEYILEYNMLEGHEDVTILPRPTPRTETLPEPQGRPDGLVIEMFHLNHYNYQEIPRWYVVRGITIRGVGVGNTVTFPFPFVCGPTVLRVDGYDFVNLFPPAYLDTPPYPNQYAAIGRPAPTEIQWANSADAQYYFGPGAYNQFVELLVTGPDACNATQSGVVPWSPAPLSSGAWGTPGAPQRWLGALHIDPHYLLARLEIAEGGQTGQTIGANGGVTNIPGETYVGSWDETNTRGLFINGEPWWTGRMAYYDYLREGVTKRGAQWWAETPGEGAREPRSVATMIVDARYYQREVSPNEFVADLTGFWVNPRHWRNGAPDPARSGQQIWTGPDGRGAPPTSLFETIGASDVYISSYYDESWYHAPTPPISPAAVTIVVTWVWGVPGTEDVIDVIANNDRNFAQRSVVFERTVTAQQAGHNNPAPPTEAPWGTMLGRLRANFETLDISLDPPEA